MSRLVVTSGSHFDPFTYEDLVKPIQDFTDAQNEASESFNALAKESSAVNPYIDRDNDEDSDAVTKYDDYIRRLKELQDNLWNNGYSYNTTRDVAAAQNAFLTDITPISEAIARRQAQDEAYHEAKRKDPSMVQGRAPKSYGLNSYMRDKTFGNDWYSYSGNSFADEIAKDAKARSSEMISNPTYRAVPGYDGLIEQTVTEGVTGDEVTAAGVLAKKILHNEVSGDELRKTMENMPNVGILADILISHADAAGAIEAFKDSPQALDQLIDYGLRGLASSVGKSTVRVIEDPTFNGGSGSGRSRTGSGSGSGGSTFPSQRVSPMSSNQTVGPDYEKTIRYLNRRLKESQPINIVDPITGTQVLNHAEASSLVYGEDIALDKYKRFGWDIRLDGNDKHTLSTFLHGQAMLNDPDTGKPTLVDVRYVPGRFKGYEQYPGVIQVKKPDESNDAWGFAEALTNEYHEARQQIADITESYRQQAPEVYNAASVDPEKRAKMYSKKGVAGDIPLTEFPRAAIANDPSRIVKDSVAVHISTADALDDGGIGKALSDVLAIGISQNLRKRGRTEHRRSYNGSTMNIHEIDDKTGLVDFKTVKKPKDIFKFDKSDKGSHITNIDDFEITAHGILNDYITVLVGRKKYAVGLDLFNLVGLDSDFDRARRHIINIETDESNTAENNIATRRVVKTKVLEALAGSIKEKFGATYRTFKETPADGKKAESITLDALGIN